jgi:hypothetical protein
VGWRLLDHRLGVYGRSAFSLASATP